MKKWRNEKGFTLVELMATLAILALIVAIAVPAVGNVLAKSKDSAEASSIELMERAGELAYLDALAFDDEENERYQIPTLAEEGYLKLSQASVYYDAGNYVEKLENGTFVYNGMVSGADGSDSLTPVVELVSFEHDVAGLMSWVVPDDGVYRVSTWGAQGGRGGYGGFGYEGPGETGVYGDYVQFEIWFDADTELVLRVGGQGGNGGQGERDGGGGGGGGGATDIYVDGAPLVAAKGGAGGKGADSMLMSSMDHRKGVGGARGYNGGEMGKSSNNGRWGGAGGGSTNLSTYSTIDSAKTVIETKVRKGGGKISIVKIPD